MTSFLWVGPTNYATETMVTIRGRFPTMLEYIRTGVGTLWLASGVLRGGYLEECLYSLGRETRQGLSVLQLGPDLSAWPSMLDDWLAGIPPTGYRHRVLGIADKRLPKPGEAFLHQSPHGQLQIVPDGDGYLMTCRPGGASRVYDVVSGTMSERLDYLATSSLRAMSAPAPIALGGLMMALQARHASALADELREWARVVDSKEAT